MLCDAIASHLEQILFQQVIRTDQSQLQGHEPKIQFPGV